MEKRSKGTAKVGLVVSTQKDSGYFHINLHPVLLDTDKPGSIRNPGDNRSWYDAKERTPLYLKDFWVTSQGNVTGGLLGELERDLKLYGWEYCFKPYRVEADDAKKMAATFAAVDRKLQKFRDEHGHPSEFSEFVVRVAKAIGAKEVLELKSRNAWSYSEQDYYRYDLAGGRARIRQLEQEYRQEILDRLPKPAPVEAGKVDAAVLAATEVAQG